jgi:hypothetical protein
MTIETIRCPDGIGSGVQCIILRQWFVVFHRCSPDG